MDGQRAAAAQPRPHLNVSQSLWFSIQRFIANCCSPCLSILCSTLYLKPIWFDGVLQSLLSSKNHICINGNCTIHFLFGLNVWSWKSLHLCLSQDVLFEMCYLTMLFVLFLVFFFFLRKKNSALNWCIHIVPQHFWFTDINSNLSR